MMGDPKTDVRGFEYPAFLQGLRDFVDSSYRNDGTDSVEFKFAPGGRCYRVWIEDIDPEKREDPVGPVKRFEVQRYSESVCGFAQLEGPNIFKAETTEELKGWIIRMDSRANRPGGAS